MQNSGIPIEIFLFLLPLVLLVILLLQLQRRHKLRKAEDYKSKGQYIESADLFANLDLRRGVRMLIEVPEATQVLVLRRLESKSTRSAVNKMLIDLAGKYKAEKQTEKAVKAYVLADRIWAAAQTHIEGQGSEIESAKKAVTLIDQYPQFIRRREDAIRNLARHAYEKRKYIAAAELLKTVGAIEEANAILVATSSKERIATQKDRTKNIYVERAIKGLESGEFEVAKKELSYAQNLISRKQEKPRTEDQHQIHEIQQILRMIDISRQYLRRNLWQQAQVAYNELLERFESNNLEIPGIIYAEIALSYEKSEPNKAIKFYNLAAARLDTSAKDTFLRRAKQIQEASGHPISQFSIEKELKKDLGFCSVCKMKITDSEDHYICPHCSSPAHYSHLAEWLKIRGTCPVCRKKISISKKTKSPT